MTTVRVRRKPLLPFFVALAGLPLMAIAFDFATGARLLRQIGDVVYNSDVDPFELRDSFLASIFGFVGVGLVAWGLRELVFPQSVVKAETDALRLSVRGPFGRLTTVPWDELEEVAATTRELDGHVVDALALTVTRPGELPDNPWNARWVGHTLVVDADHWDHPLDDVVNDIVRLRRLALTTAPPIPPAADGLTPDEDIASPEPESETLTAPIDVPADESVTEILESEIPASVENDPGDASVFNGDLVAPDVDTPESVPEDPIGLESDSAEPPPAAQSPKADPFDDPATDTEA